MRKIKRFFKPFVLILAGFRDLFIRLLPRMRKRGGFAFFVHPRNISDTYRKWPFLKLFPVPWVEWFLQRYWPIILSEIEGVKKLDGTPVRGWLITIPITAEQMLADRELAKKKIVQAVKLAEKMGAQIVGLGAFTSSITKGGEELLEKVNINLTNGNGLTSAITVADIKDLILRNPDKKILGVVGATGSIGSAVSKFLAKEKVFDSMILIGRTPAHLDELKEEIKKIETPTKVEVTNDISRLKEADFVVVATNSNSALLRSEHLKKDAIVYDITQPRNTSEEVINARPDVVFVEGGLVKVNGINFHFNFGLPRDTAFACLGETMLLAAEGICENYSIGKISVDKLEGIYQIFEKYPFLERVNVYEFFS